MTGNEKINSIIYKCKKDPIFLKIIHDSIIDYENRKAIHNESREALLENFFYTGNFVFWETDLFTENVVELENLFADQVNLKSSYVNMEPMSKELVYRLYDLQDEWCKSELHTLPKLYQILSLDLKERVSYHLMNLLKLPQKANSLKIPKIHFYQNLVSGLFFGFDENGALFSYKENK